MAIKPKPADRAPAPPVLRSYWGDDKPMAVKDAATYADMPLSSFNKLIYAQAIESIKKGGRRMVRPSAIDRYMKRATTEAT